MSGWDVQVAEGRELVFSFCGWRVVVSWPQRAGSRVLVTVRVSDSLPPRAGVVLASGQVDVLSVSQVQVVCRRMASWRSASDDERDMWLWWQRIIDEVLGWLAASSATVRSHPLALTEEVSPSWVVWPVWPGVGVTAVAGAPGSFKSLLAQAVALQAASQVRLLGANTRSPSRVWRPLFLDWEGDLGAFRRRVSALMGSGDGSVDVGYKAMSGVLTDSVDVLDSELRREGWDCVVVDSLSAASGGDLIDAQPVGRFYDGLRVLRVPVLLVAHKSHDASRARQARMYGSVMHEARVRLAWNTERVGDGSSGRVAWHAFKDNYHGRVGARLGWQVDVSSDNDGGLEAVTLTAITPGRIREEAATKDTAGRAIDVWCSLDGGSYHIGVIAEATGIDYHTVYRHITRHPDRYRQDPDDGTWSYIHTSDHTQ